MAGHQINRISDEKDNIYERMPGGGSGQFEVCIETLEEAVEKAKELELEDYTINQLKQDIAWAKKRSQEYIEYSCY